MSKPKIQIKREKEARKSAMTIAGLCVLLDCRADELIEKVKSLIQEIPTEYWTVSAIGRFTQNVKYNKEKTHEEIISLCESLIASHPKIKIYDSYYLTKWSVREYGNNTWFTTRICVKSETAKRGKIYYRQSFCVERHDSDDISYLTVGASIE